MSPDPCFFTPHVNKSGCFLFFVVLSLCWACCSSRGDVDPPPPLSLEHQGLAAPSDPCIYAVLWTLRVCLCTSQASYMSELSQEQQTSICEAHAKLKPESNLNLTADVYSVFYSKKKQEAWSYIL